MSQQHSSVILLVLIAIAVGLAVLDAVEPSHPTWLKWPIIAIVVILAIRLAMKRQKKKHEQVRTIRATRDSLLKWRWEDRHKREW